MLSIFAAMLPAASAAGSIPFQRVVWNQLPFRLGLRFGTSKVADGNGCALQAGGLRCSPRPELHGYHAGRSRSQGCIAPICPPPAAPQLDNGLTTKKSAALAPPSVPWPMPVNGALPVLVSVNT